MIKPTLHFGGTHPEVLATDLETARDMLARALECLIDVPVHARDYPEGEQAFAQAYAEQASRVARLNEILVEIQALCDHVKEGQR